MDEAFCKFIKLDDTSCICDVCGHRTKYCNAKKNCKGVAGKASNVVAPPLLQRVLNFTAAATKHALAGNPVVSEEVLKERLAICQACPLFKLNQNAVGGVCTHESCGCNVKDNISYLNKIAWADQKCPLTPPKWDKSSGV